MDCLAQGKVPGSSLMRSLLSKKYLTKTQPFWLYPTSIWSNERKSLIDSLNDQKHEKELT